MNHSSFSPSHSPCNPAFGVPFSPLLLLFPLCSLCRLFSLFSQKALGWSRLLAEFGCLLLSLSVLDISIRLSNTLSHVYSLKVPLTMVMLPVYTPGNHEA